MKQRGTVEPEEPHILKLYREILLPGLDDHILPVEMTLATD
jgi:hypothetical protein